MQMAKNKKVIIIGIGNLILRDEGVGVHAVRALEERELMRLLRPAYCPAISGNTLIPAF